MQTPDLYCDECGAANQRTATNCFACQHPLKPAPASYTQGSSLPATESGSSGPFQIQINLSSGSLTMIQLQQPQIALNLLHDRYIVLEKVGTGGFGAVYKARDARNQNRLVAIKAIELDTLSASQAIEATDTFNRELSMLSSLDHWHLPRVYEHFLDETHWYLVMDFIAGEPLDEYLQQIEQTCLPLNEVIDIGLQLCDVLRYLHQLKPPIIFRDVKPANIMRTPGGHLYLIDFGIARRFKRGQAKDTAPLGSPGFAAPEQYGKAQTSPRSDIYGLGATLYFLLTGHDPANTPFNLPAISTFCPSLPEPLVELITSMLALDVYDRPESVLAVQQVLARYALPDTRNAPAAVSKSIPDVVSPTWTGRLSSLLNLLISVIVIFLILALCLLSTNLIGR